MAGQQLDLVKAARIRTPSRRLKVDPYAGAFNTWNVGVDADTVAVSILQQDESVPAYVCGEAYSHDPGWVEGALDTAEQVVECSWTCRHRLGCHLGRLPKPTRESHVSLGCPAQNVETCKPEGPQVSTRRAFKASSGCQGGSDDDSVRYRNVHRTP